MRTEAIYRASGGVGNWVVQVDGLDSLLRYLKQTDADAEKELKAALRAAATPALSKARAYAQTLADDGTYARSLKTVIRSNGYTVALQSNDPASRVKEFARPGAKTLTSKGTPLANARLMKRSGVGVPRKVHTTPRAMVPAVNAVFETTWRNVDAALDRILGR